MVPAGTIAVGLSAEEHTKKIAVQIKMFIHISIVDTSFEDLKYIVSITRVRMS